MAANNQQIKSIDIIQDKSKYNGSALVVAAINNHLPVLNFMLSKGLDVNVKDKDGNAALIGASFEGHVEAVSLILQHKPDINIIDKNGSTALICASSKGFTDIARILTQNNADINIQNLQRETAFRAAVKSDYLDVCKILLMQNADVSTFDKNGKTAFDYASIELKVLIQQQQKSKPPTQGNPLTTFRNTAYHTSTARIATSIHPAVLSTPPGRINSAGNGVYVPRPNPFRHANALIVSEHEQPTTVLSLVDSEILKSSIKKHSKPESVPLSGPPDLVLVSNSPTSDIATSLKMSEKLISALDSTHAKVKAAIEARKIKAAAIVEAKNLLLGISSDPSDDGVLHTEKEG